MRGSTSVLLLPAPDRPPITLRAPVRMPSRDSPVVDASAIAQPDLLRCEERARLLLSGDAPQDAEWPEPAAQRLDGAEGELRGAPDELALERGGGGRRQRRGTRVGWRDGEDPRPDGNELTPRPAALELDVPRDLAREEARPLGAEVDLDKGVQSSVRELVNEASVRRQR